MAALIAMISKLSWWDKASTSSCASTTSRRSHRVAHVVRRPLHGVGVGALTDSTLDSPPVEIGKSDGGSSTEDLLDARQFLIGLAALDFDLQLMADTAPPKARPVYSCRKAVLDRNRDFFPAQELFNRFISAPVPGETHIAMEVRQTRLRIIFEMFRSFAPGTVSVLASQPAV